MHPTIQALIDHFELEPLPVEGTFFQQSYRSSQERPNGDPAGTAIIGLYCNEPLSLSCFHRLTYDEVWHFYGGDPLSLYLLFEDGSSTEIIMGPDPLQGHAVQYVVPAGVWQGGCVREEGRYALFGCTMAPGFTGACFEGGIAEKLIKQYPDQEAIIRRLSVNGHTTQMPDGFSP